MKVIIIGTVKSSVFGFRLQLLKELRSRGCEITYYLSELDAALAQKARDELGVECRLYPLSRTSTNPFKDLTTLFFLYREFKKEKPNVVFSYFSKPVIWGTLAAKLARVPKRVAMIEGLGYSFTRTPRGFSKKQRIIQCIQILLYRVALPHATGLVLLNPDDKNELLYKNSITASNVCLLGGIGVNLTKFMPSEDTSIAPVKYGLRFIFIGRLLAEKGVREYVASAKLVKQKYPNTSFVILGGVDEVNPGALKHSTLDALTESGVIEYPGHVINVNDWIANSDVFVLPSYREGIPVSTQEAMASGKAILTTDVPGCRETVIEGMNGFIVPPWDINQLTERMIWMIKNPDRVKQMGKVSRELAEERFDAVIQSKRLADKIME